MTTLNKKGYIALITSIILSCISLIITIKQNYTGWNHNFNILETENKKLGEIISENCTNKVLINFLKDTSYTGNETINYREGICNILSIEKNYPEEGLITIKTQSIASKTYTNNEVVIDLNEIYFGEIPLPRTPENSGSKNLKYTINSWKEIPRL